MLYPAELRGRVRCQLAAKYVCRWRGIQAREQLDCRPGISSWFKGPTGITKQLFLD